MCDHAICRPVYFLFCLVDVHVRMLMLSDLSHSYFYFTTEIILQRDHRIHTLDISGNDIGGLGVIYIAEMLAVNDTITYLVKTNITTV